MNQPPKVGVRIIHDGKSYEVTSVVPILTKMTGTIIVTDGKRKRSKKI